MAQITITADQSLVDQTIAALYSNGGWCKETELSEKEFARSILLKWLGTQITQHAEFQGRLQVQQMQAKLEESLAAAHDQVKVEFAE